MSLAIQVPIKATPSQRVPNKNFREIAGKPMWQWTLEKFVEIFKEDGNRYDADIYLDSEDTSVLEPIKLWWDRQEVKDVQLFLYQRDAWLSGDSANGNHLLTSFAYNTSTYDNYCQLFITSPLFRKEVFKDCFDAYYKCANAPRFYPDYSKDSLFPITKETGFLWTTDDQGECVPLNYTPSKPDGLPRSQDNPIFKETTTLYLIKKESLFKYNTRIGVKPFLFEVGPLEAIDIDTPKDFEYAEKLLNEV